MALSYDNVCDSVCIIYTYIYNMYIPITICVWIERKVDIWNKDRYFSTYRYGAYCAQTFKTVAER